MSSKYTGLETSNVTVTVTIFLSTVNDGIREDFLRADFLTFSRELYRLLSWSGQGFWDQTAGGDVQLWLYLMRS